MARTCASDHTRHIFLYDVWVKRHDFRSQGTAGGAGVAS